MKVCLLNDSFPPVIDGVVNVMMNYANYLQSDFDSEVVVGTPRYPDADYSQYPYPVVAYPSLDTASVTNGYRTGVPFAEEEMARLETFAPDIIHTHCPAASTVVARILRERTNAPVILTYHTKYDIDIRRYMKPKFAADEAIHAMVGNIEACDEVWTVSRGAGESLREIGFTGEYRVMNNGVDFPKGRVDAETVAAVTEGYDLPADVPVLLFVGRMITYKGIPLILDALKQLSDAGQDYRMVFIGKGPDLEQLRARAESLGLMDTESTPGKCIFLGAVYDRNVLRAWHTRADLFLFPSTFDTNGLVVREAAACGLACVLIRNSCAAEGITDGQNGYIIEETAEAMAELLIRVLPDRSKLHEIGQHAMDELYLSWKDCVAQAYERYGEVLEERKSGLLMPRRKQMTDYLVDLTSHGMERMTKRRIFYDRLIRNFETVTAGMIENGADEEDTLGSLLTKLTDTITHGIETLRKG